MSTLRELALKYGTDKAGHHEYCEAYDFFLAPWRHDAFNMLEIGVGGYQFPEKGGESLRMWHDYFPNAMIFALDLHPKKFEQPRTRIYQGDQTDPGILLYMIDEMVSKPRLIIDDGSHINPLTLKSFEILWPHLAPGGIYVIEDCHTSYWEKIYEGGSHDNTVVNYFKAQADWLNLEHWNGKGLRLQEMGAADNVESIHFFKEIIFIRKKA